jgi:D-alanine-D-alanine ligase-like ATP-grasp enzyme
MIPGFTNVSMFPLLWQATVNNLISIIDRPVST